MKNDIIKKEVESEYLEIEAEINNWSKVRNFINLFIKNIYSDNATTDNFIVACEEIYINIVKYAYIGKKDKINIKCSYMFGTQELCVEFIDYGIEFDPTKQTVNNTITLPLKNRKIGGLGILIAKNVSDHICYRRVNNKNILKLFKKVKKGSVTNG